MARRLRDRGWVITAVGVALCGLLTLPSAAAAQGLKDQLVGAWKLVAIYNEENGVKQYNFGENPVGMLMFDAAGHVLQFLARPDLPTFASANRLRGTDEENRGVVRGTISGFGTYTVADRDTDNVTIQWVSSSFPNRAGTTETRTYKITGDELTAVNTTASSGGTSYARYVRAK